MGGQRNGDLDRSDRQLTGIDQDLARSFDKACDRVTRSVTSADLVQPILDVNVLAVRTRSQIGVPKNGMGSLNTSRIGRIAQDFKLAEYVEICPALFCLQRARGVMRNEVAYDLREALLREKAGSIDGMEPGAGVTIANIVQCRCYHQIRSQVRLNQHRK